MLWNRIHKMGGGGENGVRICFLNKKTDSDMYRGQSGASAQTLTARAGLLPISVHHLALSK